MFTVRYLSFLANNLTQKLIIILSDSIDMSEKQKTHIIKIQCVWGSLLYKDIFSA